MGFWDWLRGKREIAPSPSADSALLAALLGAEQARIASYAELEKLDREVKLKEKALELENLDRISENKRKDAENREKIRQIRRENLNKANEVKRARKAAGNSGGPQASHAGTPGCVVCADPSSPALTAHEIQWHAAGHPGAMVQ